MRRYVIILSAVLVLLFIGLPESNASAAIADGTHSLKFQVNKPDSSSASMANDYFLKPAKLIVSNGSMKVQVTIKNSSWVTEFNPPGGATVISSNPSADQRVVQFSISSLNKLKVAMKIDINDIDYHHAYTVDFVFDGSGLPEKQEQAVTPPANTNNTNNNQNAGSTNQQPATTNKPSSSSTSSSGTVNSNTSNNTTNIDENAATTTELEDKEIDGQAPTTSQEENPETSDPLPILAMIIFILAFVVLLSSKKRQTT